MNLSDNAALRRWIAQRDAEAFRVIVQRHAGIIYATCRRILRNDSEAEEVAQECFETLVRTNEQDLPNKLGPWLHGTATYKCLMRLRAEGRRRQREAQYAAMQSSETEPKWNDIYSYVDEAIAELPEEIRSPVVAHFLYGQSHGKIARTTGVPRRTVSNRVKKGLDLIGKSLRKREIIVPAAGFASLLSAGLAEAVTVPVPLLNSLGKLALAHSARAGTGISLSRQFGEVLGGLFAMNKVVVGMVAILMVIGGLWVTQNADDQIPDEERAQLTAPQESTAADLVQPTDEVIPERLAGKPMLSPPDEADSVGGSVSGTVRYYGTEEPASGVQLKLRRQSELVTETATDDKGEYMLVGLTPGPEKYVLRADVDGGFITFPNEHDIRLNGDDELTGVDFLLAIGGAISGTVTERTITYHPWRLATVTVDPQNQMEARMKVDRAMMSTADAPLPGVKIVLEGHPLNSRNLLRLESTSDEQGQYAFPIVPPGTHDVRAQPPEGAALVRDEHPDVYQKVRISPNEDRNGVDFSFRFDSVSITGRVTNTRGEPVEGVELTAKYGPKAMGETSRKGTVMIKTVSGEDGRYRLGGVHPTTFRQASYYLTNGDVPQAPEWEGWMVAVHAHAIGYVPTVIHIPPITEDLVRNTTSTMGQFTNLQRRMGMDMDDEFTSPDEVILPASRGNDITNVNFVLERETVVVGRVVDTRGNILPQLRVHIISTDPPAGRPIPLAIEKIKPDWVETDDNGQFLFEAVPSGIYNFEVQAKGGREIARNPPLRVNPGEFIESIEVIVGSTENRGSIAGLVLDATTRQPIKDLFIQVAHVESSDELPPLHGHLEIDDSQQGAFLIEDISPGTATLWVSADGRGLQEVQVEVASGQTRNITVYLTAAAVLEGYVTLNGNPAQNASVSPWSVETQRNAIKQGGSQNSAQTNKEGYYKIQGLKKGTYLVKFAVRLPDLPNSAQAFDQAEIELKAGRSTILDFDFGGSATVRGSFSHPDIELSWYVAVLTGDDAYPDGPAHSGQKVASAWKVEDSGYYEIGNLPPGTYTVIGTCREKSDTGFVAVAEQSKTVTLGEGETAEVDFNFR